MSKMHEATAAPTGLSRALVLLLATGAGVSVASLYYSQPMLEVLARDLHVPASAAGMLPMLNQLGYALGIALLAPLGDRYDRRRVILVKSVLLALAMLGSALATGLSWLLAAGLATGLVATLAQDFVPAAATLAPAAQRGRIVGTVMTGLLLGILLSRVASGLIAGQFGWRAVYLLATAAVVAVGLASWRRLPAFAATTQLGYGALLRSLGTLWRQHPALRRAVVAQALLSVGFSAFWSTLAVMLAQPPLQLGSAVAGAFGLAGAVGAIAAPLAGRIADRHGPGYVARAGAALAAASFAALALMPWLAPQAQLILLVVVTIGFDLGVQASLIAHQSIVYGLDPAARSRLNAVLFTGVFVGMAAGAALGALALARFGWMGVAGVATLAALAGLGVRLLPQGLASARACQQG
ncbi:MFS transporter [Pseudoxanthomonas composti]|nr:MFS transporter [Pseudoxanthomonas composti]